MLSENGTKPSWTHSAKLQLRSNSPSRFSLESHSSSPTLEMIGEVADTKLSACAYSSSPKSERLPGVRSALAALEGNPGTRRLIEHVHSKAAVAQSEQRGGTQLGANNNVTAGSEQVSPRHGAAAVATKEQKQRNGVADSPSVKRTASKTGLQNERSPKKRAATSSTSSSSLSPASPAVDKLPSRTQAKSAALTSSIKDKSDGPARAGKAASSRTATPSKKGSSQTAEAAHQKRSSSPGLQSSHPQRKTSPRGGGAGEKSSASGRTKATDRSGGRESSQTAGIAEKKANTGGPTSRSGPTGRTEGRSVRGADTKAVGRSSSSSSSITSLRSSAQPAGGGAPSRAAQRSSKTEEKGLSFFKTALRPKDARKSSDGGKAEAKGVPEDACGEKDGQQVGRKAQNVSSEGKTNGIVAKDKESAKASSAAKHSLLPSAKSKLSAAESTNQPSGNTKEPSKKEPAKKTMQSRKIPINPAQTSHKTK